MSGTSEDNKRKMRAARRLLQSPMVASVEVACITSMYLVAMLAAALTISVWHQLLKDMEKRPMIVVVRYILMDIWRRGNGLPLNFKPTTVIFSLPP